VPITSKETSTIFCINFGRQSRLFCQVHVLIGITVFNQIAVEKDRQYGSCGSIPEAAVCEMVKIARHLTSLVVELAGALLLVRMRAISSTYQNWQIILANNPKEI
jgi:hypothetical protein